MDSALPQRPVAARARAPRPLRPGTEAERTSKAPRLPTSARARIAVSEDVRSSNALGVLNTRVLCPRLRRGGDFDLLRSDPALVEGFDNEYWGFYELESERASADVDLLGQGAAHKPSHKLYTRPADQVQCSAVATIRISSTLNCRHSSTQCSAVATISRPWLRAQPSLRTQLTRKCACYRHQLTGLRRAAATIMVAVTRWWTAMPRLRRCRNEGCRGIPCSLLSNICN